jgi:hypothetical protein
MNIDALKRATVSVFVSDPWEFGSECGTGPFLGTVIDVSPNSILVELAKPIFYGGRTLVAVIAKPRYAGDRMEALANGPLTVNLVLITSDFLSSFAIQAESSREGIPVLGSIECLGGPGRQ